MNGFFGELYLRSTRPFLPEERTQAEVSYLAAQLAPRRAFPVLDAGCGHGRHAAGLAGCGFRVVGLELDALSLAERERGAYQLVRGDFLNAPFRRAFGAAFSWYSTLFVGSDADNLRALHSLAGCLQAGGLLILQTTPFEWLVRHPRAVYRGTLPDGSHLEEDSVFDAATGTERGARRLRLPDGRELTGTYLTRHYPWDRLSGLVAEAGFKPLWVHADLERAPLAPGSKELIAGFERAGE